MSKLEFILIATVEDMEKSRKEAKDMGFEDEERLYFVISKFARALAHNASKAR